MGRGVTPVGEGVDQYLPDIPPPGEAHQRFEVVDVAVDSAVGNQSHQVQPPPGLPDPGQGRKQHLAPVQVALLDGLVDPGQVLVDDPPGPQADVPHLRVADDPLRKPDRLSGGLQEGPGIAGEEIPQVRGIGVGDCVEFLALAEPPPVQDDEGQRKNAAIGDSSHVSPSFPACTGQGHIPLWPEIPGDCRPARARGRIALAPRSRQSSTVLAPLQGGGNPAGMAANVAERLRDPAIRSQA